MKLTNRRQTDTILQDIFDETEIIERHLHSRESWFGLAAGPDATHWGDLDSLLVYTAISGAGVYGADANDEALVLGSADTPVDAGMTFFDMHDIFIVEVDSANPYMLRIVWGTGTMADAIIAEQYSLMPIIAPNLPVSQAGGIVEPIQIERLAAGTQIWIQCKNANNNAEVAFLVGLHEYAE